MNEVRNLLKSLNALHKKEELSSKKVELSALSELQQQAKKGSQAWIQANKLVDEYKKLENPLTSAYKDMGKIYRTLIVNVDNFEQAAKELGTPPNLFKEYKEAIEARDNLKRTMDFMESRIF